MAKYNYLSYSKVEELRQDLPETKKEQYQARISEGHLVAHIALQASLDSVDTAACTIATTVVLRQASWLHLSGFPKEVQTTIEDLPFEGSKLFAVHTDYSLHSLKDSLATLRSLNIYTLALRRCPGKVSSSPAIPTTAVRSPAEV